MVDELLVPLDVTDRHRRISEVRQGQGLRCEVGEGRGCAEADLDDLVDVELGCGEEELLRLDPADRGRELPAEELDEDRAGKLRLVLDRLIPVLQGRFELDGGDNSEDLADELLIQSERGRREVRDVLILKTLMVDLVRKQLGEAVAELRNTVVKDSGVEGNVDARDEHERSLAAGLAGTLGRVSRECLEALAGACDRVLLACEVEVDDLKELAGCLGNPFDVVDDLIVADIELVRAQSTHLVVRPALLIARHQVVHGCAAVEDELEDRLQIDRAGVGGQCVVFAERGPREVRTIDHSTSFAQTRSLSECEGCESDLRELGEVENALRVTVGHSLGGEDGRVVPHESEDREPESLPRVDIGALPHVSGCLGGGALSEAHALGLDALTRVDVSRGGGRGGAGADGDELAVDPAGDLEDEAAAFEAPDALDGDVDFVVQVDEAEHTVGPARELEAAALVARRGGSMLGDRGEPHAVHERSLKAGDACGVGGGVDRVEVA